MLIKFDLYYIKVKLLFFIFGGEDLAKQNLKINSKQIRLMKPVTHADYNQKTVLTNSVWEYVELWLKRNGTNEAKESLFYWKQAKYFFDASEILPTESKPLTAYYCCLNAAKALLAIRGKSIDFNNLSHGITSDRRQWKDNNIKHAEVTFLGSGVLYELSKCLGEEACKKNYSVYTLLYNIPCIHRAFSITYNASELFIPINHDSFVFDSSLKKGWFQFFVDKTYSSKKILGYLPKCFEIVPNDKDDISIVRFRKRFDWNKSENIKCRLKGLSSYHGKIRKDIHYVLGDSKLWYIKKDLPKNPDVINRGSITLIFATMHWLSELVRYNPKKFNQMMQTKQNWLLHEFVDTCLYQYIDEISAEMTGVDIMCPGIRK